MVDVDMAGHVQTYIDTVQEYAKHGTLIVEESLPIDHITGEKEAEGTADAVIVGDDELTVIDLKFGAGVTVSAFENGQLMIYGLGALEKYSLVSDFKRVRMVIVQPRDFGGISEYDMPVEALIEWGLATSAKADIHG